jgi:hypothetical protein
MYYVSPKVDEVGMDRDTIRGTLSSFPTWPLSFWCGNGIRFSPTVTSAVFAEVHRVWNVI